MSRRRIIVIKTIFFVRSPKAALVKSWVRRRQSESLNLVNFPSYYHRSPTVRLDKPINYGNPSATPCQFFASNFINGILLGDKLPWMYTIYFSIRRRRGKNSVRCVNRKCKISTCLKRLRLSKREIGKMSNRNEKGAMLSNY